MINNMAFNTNATIFVQNQFFPSRFKGLSVETIRWLNKVTKSKICVELTVY